MVIEAKGARVLSAWPAHQGAVGQEGVRPVRVVEVLMLDLVALASCGIVNVGVE